MKKGKENSRKKNLRNIQQSFFRTQLVLIISLSAFLTAAGIIMNLHADAQKRDQNLQNIAEAIAHSQMLIDMHSGSEDNTDSTLLIDYIDSLKQSLSDIDVISVVSRDNVRLYHSTHELIGTQYDGTSPDFIHNEKKFYIANDRGPSGTQRRAYAAVYDNAGDYVGFVITIMLTDSIRDETVKTLGIFSLITIAAIFVELLISSRQSTKIKNALLGYEPDAFSAMYKIRDNILESLDEGILAIDSQANVQFINNAAAEILGLDSGDSYNAEKYVGKPLKSLHSESLLAPTLMNAEKEFNIQGIQFPDADILVDRFPIKERGSVIGAVGILHNRTEYTKLMEDLTGTRYLVDSMRANNHDFTNKLHVILGLIQMEMYDEARDYIENITILQRKIISRVVHAIDEPAVAALLIGKIARASELNIKFILREGSSYSKSDMPLPAETLVTIIGNLIDNALDAMNDTGIDGNKELLLGIYSSPDAVLITADDTGSGISEQDMDRVFEKGFSTKGAGRGTGLHQVKMLVDGLGGKITLESQKGIGTSFSVNFKKS